MNNNENNNEILSFEELRKKLGMDETPTSEAKPKKAEKPNSLSKPEPTSPNSAVR